MATGRSNQLAKQVGEYLVAATFSGSVPDFDIIATDSEYRSVPVQVKAITGRSWQFDIRRFIDVQLEGNKQILGEPKRGNGEVICVMVALSKYGEDRFYVLPWNTLQQRVVDGYRKYLDLHGGVRPRKFDSFHVAIGEAELAEFRDAWLAEFRERSGLCV